ncbi:MAG: hypothetical protein ACREMB_18495 [Candidatus Rokuibacteriota bacterium]
MRRRDFLRTGSAGLVGVVAATSDALAGQGSRATLAAPTSDAVAVGYWIGSEGRPDLRRLALASAGAADDRRAFEPDVAPADRLSAETPRIPGATVRLGLHGLVEAERRAFQRPLSHLSLLVDFAVPDVGTVRFAAWRYDRLPVRNVSRAVRLVVPLGPAGDLRVTLERRPGQPPAEARLAKLRRGVYFLALPGPGGSQPDWSRLQFREAGAMGARWLVGQGLFGLEPARFDYLVVSIDTVSDPGAEQA